VNRARFIAAARLEFPAEVIYYSLIYRPEPEGIVIFAVAHHARRPYYWQSRARAR